MPVIDMAYQGFGEGLQDEFSIYIVGSSRISVATIAPDDVDYLAQSIAELL